MSTIERAAARLGGIGKQDGPRERRDADLRSGESTPQAGANPAGRRPETLAGAGRVDLDVESLAAKGFVVAANVDSELATDFRRIKRPLLLSVKKAESEGSENPPNLVVITSSLPAEGKTFTSLNLSFSIATEVDRSVLLVDGDVAKNSVSDVLGIQYELGLIDILSKGNGQIEDGILQTNIDGLEILPSGPRLPNTDELFASDRMRRLMHDVARRDPRRLVLIDAPPLLARTEAPNLARLAGHVVVLIEADRTPQASVNEALGLLHGCERVSLVLNKVTRRASDRHAYGYGYGYGYAPKGN